MNNIDSFYEDNSNSFAESYLGYLSEVLGRINRSEISEFINTLKCARQDGRKIFFIGNGGSAATASHFANDLAIGTYCREKPFRAVSLTDNVAIITAIANDFGYEDIFLRQLEVIGEKNDLVVGISASGNSQNIIKAFEYAKNNNMHTFAITAFDGGYMKKIADKGIHVPTGFGEYGPAEDSHMILDHLVGAYLMRFVARQDS